MEPLGIVIPRDEEDLLTTLRIAAEHDVPVTARGAATGITGSCLGKGLIIDTSRYMDQIREININKEYAICEPGVVQDRLNEALGSFGYRLGPETSTGNRATIGGMLANNSAGAKSLLYGSMRDHILSVRLALQGGTILECTPLSDEQFNHKLHLKNSEGDIYRGLDKVLKKYREDIERNTPDIPRHVCGYNLKGLLRDSSHNLSQIIVGSEGTLGIVTEIKVRIVKKPMCTGLCLLFISNLIEGLKEVPQLLSFHPIALEMIDNNILTLARRAPSIRASDWIDVNAEAIFVAEFQGKTTEEVTEKLNTFANAAKQQKTSYRELILTDSKAMKSVWEVRTGLGLLLSKKSYSRALAFIEDISIAPENLAAFMNEFIAYLRSKGKSAGIYGHIGSGCMHIRPYIDLRDPSELALMKEIMIDTAALVKKYGGDMSGEHGDGLIRSWLNERQFGKNLYQAFCDVKSAFDPRNLMNPGKIVQCRIPDRRFAAQPINSHQKDKNHARLF